MLGLAAVRAAVDLVADAGIDAIRAKSMRLTAVARDVSDELDLDFASPRDPSRCGAHIAVRHEHAAPITRALRARSVVPDLRPPDIVRVGMSPLTTRFADVWDGLSTMRDVIDSGAWQAHVDDAPRVT